ncbi:hypothetical protein P9265_19375 [Schinkia azotoformans]|uniref:hypothetical protein n=1 Tax=Schinkia azotoformans TaxID=1454 RepID=UPI002E1DB0A8|nr:hypothetical protein [Schinkia azotoformans]
MGYDENCEFPLSSNWPFTKYFFLDSFIRGYRLHHSAEELFEVFLDLRRKFGLPHKVEIPMQYITLTIEYALKKFGNDGLNLPSIEKTHWEEAINNSGYIQADGDISFYFQKDRYNYMKNILNEINEKYICPYKRSTKYPRYRSPMQIAIDRMENRFKLNYCYFFIYKSFN